jgi:hypothetical protein
MREWPAGETVVSVASTKGGEESAYLQDFLLSIMVRERMYSSSCL